MKTTELSGMTFKVDTNGDIYQDGVKLKQYCMHNNY